MRDRGLAARAGAGAGRRGRRAGGARGRRSAGSLAGVCVAAARARCASAARRNSSPYDISRVSPNRRRASADLYDTPSRLRAGFAGQKVLSRSRERFDSQLRFRFLNAE
jgi:hypothetical protein